MHENEIQVKNRNLSDTIWVGSSVVCRSLVVVDIES